MSFIVMQSCEASECEKGNTPIEQSPCDAWSPAATAAAFEHAAAAAEEEQVHYR